MNKLFSLLLLFGAINVYPAPVYYTFTGSVSLIIQDKGGYAAANDIKAGLPVTYIFVVDTAMPGYTKSGGVKTDKSDINNVGYTANNFLDSLLRPSLFSPAITDLSNGSFFGYHTITQLGTNTRHGLAFQTIKGDGNKFSQTIIYLPDSSAADFPPKLGTLVTATEAYSDGSIAASSVSLKMTLTAISNTEPSMGIRRTGIFTTSWMQASLEEGRLIIKNQSGENALAKIMDLSGKSVFKRSIGEKTFILATSLPPGPFILQVTTPGRPDPVVHIFGL